MRPFWLLNIAILGLLSLGGAQRVGTPAPALIPSGEWFNSEPTTLENLKGKVVLVNFWVFSCYNCHNSLPALRDYYARFKPKGFEIMGVHTPEFASDKPGENVRESLLRDNVTWPVVQDNDYKTWRAYNNRFWPAFYLVDRKGMIRYVQTGEISSRFPSGIKRLEAEIEKLLAE